MGTYGTVVWGKSGELLSHKCERDTTVELAKYAALDELREKLQMSSGGDGSAIDGKKLVILDHLGNQPQSSATVSSYRGLFIFVRPSRDVPREHPDTLPADFFSQHNVELVQQDIPPLPTPSPGASPVALLGVLRDHVSLRAERCRLYSQVARSRADFCTKSASALQLQSKARDAVCAHIGQFSAKVADGYAELKERIDACGKKFADLLGCFEEDTRRLHDVPLHPSLKAEGATTLADCVHDITPWKERCHEKWQGLLAKLTDFEEDLHRVKREVEEVNNALPTGEVDFERLEEAGTETRDTATSLRVLQEEAEKCLNEVADRLAAMQGGHKAQSPEAGMEAVVAFQETIRRQEAKERQLFKRLKGVEEACQVCSRSRQHIQGFMKKHVERAVNLTSDVLRMQRRVTSYAAALDGVSEYFSQLDIVRFMPEAYRWGVVELYRRIHYHRKVACVVTTAQQLLSCFKAEEEVSRKEWNESLGPYVPEGILDALHQPIVSVKVETAPPVSEMSFPSFEKPHDTPESTIRFYDRLDIKVPRDTPQPPTALKSLHSAPQEQELDKLVSSFSLALERQQDPVAAALTASTATPAPLSSLSDSSTHAPPGGQGDAGAAQQARQEDAANDAEMARLRRQVEDLQSEVASLRSQQESEREGMNTMLARCCQVEECVRVMPGMDGFSLEDPQSLKDLREMLSGDIDWEKAGVSGSRSLDRSLSD